MSEVWYLRGEGGAINPMTPPFGEGIAARLRAGYLVRVNEDGSPYTGEPVAVADAPATLAEQRVEKELAETAASTALLPMPDRSARKGEWVKYAASTGSITESAANDLTQRELVERFGG